MEYNVAGFGEEKEGVAKNERAASSSLQELSSKFLEGGPPSRWIGRSKQERRHAVKHRVAYVNG